MNPKRLPIVRLEIDGEYKCYYADARLGEYRNCNDPHDVIDESEVDADMGTVINNYEVIL